MVDTAFCALLQRALAVVNMGARVAQFGASFDVEGADR